MKLCLKQVPLGEQTNRDDIVLFSESNTRFLVEVAPKHRAKFEKMLAGVAIGAIGRVMNNQGLEVYGFSGKRVLSATLTELKEAWQKPLRW